ncbi:MAG: D-alanyl-D-alanine carboxypeptidase/D-alanyl-D-alanine-endopeptidase [Pseudomonadota bacterium]
MRAMPSTQTRLIRSATLWVLAMGMGCAAHAAELTRLPQAVRQALAQAHIPLESVSALVVPVGASTPVLRYRATKAMNPGSVIKLVTTAAAVDQLGPDFQWQTRFYVDGPIRNGELQGNLYVQGGGDPKLVLERILEAYAQVQSLGVRTIRGDWVLDHAAFELPTKDPADFDGELLRPYNVQPDALLVNFKSVILKFQPDLAKGRVDVVAEPPLAGLRVPPTVPLRRGRCGDWRSQLKATVDNPSRFSFGGSYASGCGQLEWPVAYIEPERYAQKALLGLWQSIGGELKGKMREGRVPAHARLLWSAPSLPLHQIIADVNKFSNNVMAQQVFLTLGHQPPRPATFEQSREAVAQWWRQSVSAQLAPPTVDNGSGLSRVTRISAEQLGVLLQHAAQQPHAQTFIDSLSIAGVDGTVQSLGRDGRSPRSVGNARLKSGTLKDVRALAGYVNTRSGQAQVVVIMINHERAKDARRATHALIEWAASRR